MAGLASRIDSRHALTWSGVRVRSHAVQPTPHQRWWGLVPNDHLDLVEDNVDDLLFTRSLIHLILFSATQ